MFHLIVNGDRWAQAQDWIPGDRVFEDTEDAIVKQFKPDGVLDTTRVATEPALFVSEIGVRGSQQARVGRIIRAREVGGRVIIDYTFDSYIPPIANSMRELGI